MTIIEFMKEFEERKGLDAEEVLFYNLDYIYDVYDNSEDKEVRLYDAKNRLDKVKEAINDSSEEEIDSNIYLSNVRDFLDQGLEIAADLLVEHRAEKNKTVSCSAYVEDLPTRIDEASLLHLPVTNIYNDVVGELEKMYAEIVSLYIFQEKNDEEIFSVEFERISDVEGKFTANFLNLNDEHSPKEKVKVKSRFDIKKQI